MSCDCLFLLLTKSFFSYILSISLNITNELQQDDEESHHALHTQQHIKYFLYVGCMNQLCLMSINRNQ